MLKRRFITLCYLCLVPFGLAQAEALRYEKVFSQITVKDNRLILSVDENGSVALHRPPFLRQAGDFQWQLDADELQSLWVLLNHGALSQIDQRLLERNLSQRQSTEYKTTSNTDISYFELQQDAFSAKQTLQISGLDGWAELFDDQEELKTLQSVEQELWHWMDQRLSEESAND